MGKEINEFCQAVIKKTKNDKLIKEEKLDWQYDYRERISFGLIIMEKAPGIQLLGFTGYYPKITLDQEDIDYFYNKYSKKLDAELEKNIKELKQQYK